MVKVALVEITSLNWKFELSQLNYFKGNFCNYFGGLCTFTKRRILQSVFFQNKLLKFSEKLLNKKLRVVVFDLIYVKP